MPSIPSFTIYGVVGQKLCITSKTLEGLLVNIKTGMLCHKWPDVGFVPEESTKRAYLKILSLSITSE